MEHLEVTTCSMDLVYIVFYKSVLCCMFGISCCIAALFFINSSPQVSMSYNSIPLLVFIILCSCIPVCLLWLLTKFIIYINCLHVVIRRWRVGTIQSDGDGYNIDSLMIWIASKYFFPHPLLDFYPSPSNHIFEIFVSLISKIH